MTLTVVFCVVVVLQLCANKAQQSVVMSEIYFTVLHYLKDNSRVRDNL